MATLQLLRLSPVAYLLSGVFLAIRFTIVGGASKVQRHVRVHRNAAGDVIEPWEGKSVQDLHREYSNIFRHGNRNAASHLWSSFLIDRAPFMPEKRFRHLSGGYCAVSGSPVGPGDGTRYRLNLERVDGTGKVAGFMYYCCWPCVCDTQDFIKVDTKTITTLDGPKQYNFAVIGNPCDRPSELTKSFVQPFDRRSTTIAESAQELRCGKGGKLEGATMSDHNYVIISMFFDASKRPSGFQDESDFEFMCEDRKNQGYNSGMGEIFRRVAAISPIQVRALLAAPSTLTAKQLRAEAVRRGIDTRGIADKDELVQLLERSQEEDLQKLSIKQLRIEASRLNVDVRGVADKAELVDLILRARTPRVSEDARACSSGYANVDDGACRDAAM